MSLWYKYDFRGEIRHYKNKLTLIDPEITKYLGTDYKPFFDHWHIQKVVTSISIDEWFVFLINGEKRYYKVWPTDMVVNSTYLGIGKPGERKFIQIKQTNDKPILLPKPVNIKSKYVKDENGKMVAPKCCYCDIELTSKTFTRDHIIPRVRGGKNVASNIKPCCNSCNTEKGSLMLHSYIQMLCLMQSEEHPYTVKYKLLQTKIINANNIAKEINSKQLV